jgi:hypothetical protein
MPILASTLIQTRADVGFDISEPDYEVTGGVGTFWINYAGGAYGQAPAARAELVVPSLTAQLLPSGKWSATFQGSGAFTLPTFLQQYQYAGADIPAVEMTRNSLLAAELTYTDNARVRASFEEATQNVSGASSGTVTSAGLSATWQIAPAISLRAWTMHVTDTAPVYPTGLPPYGGVAPTVNAFWLSYDNNAAVRIDVIYRRDLLENAPFYHFDAAISGPIVDQLRWYAGSEDWMHRTFVNVGLRFAAR